VTRWATSGQGFVHERILQVGAAKPQEPSLSTSSASWTYRELMDAARGTARELKLRGVGPEQVVAIRADRSPSTIVAMIATLLAGGAYVPIDPSMPPELLQELQRRLGTIANLEGDGEFGVSVHGTIPEESDAREPRKLASNNLAYIILTSGSTGSPKAVGVEHRNLWNSTVARDWYQTPPRAFRFLMTQSPSFDATVYDVYWTLMHGGELIIPSTDELVDPIALGRMMAARPVTYLNCNPSFYSLLVDTIPPETMQSVVQVSVGGDVLTPDLVSRHRKAVPQARLVNEYGPSECTLWCTRYEVPHTTDDPVPIGQAIPGATVHVGNGHIAVEPGTIGELYIGGHGVGRGYIGNPRETALKFLPDPRGERGARVYRSGDLVSQSDHGRLVFHGRVDNEVKVRGHRINFGMIEAAFRRMGNVEDVAVVKEREGESAHLLAFVVYSDGEAMCDEKAALERVSEILPGYALPQRVISVRQIPRNERGKVDRQQVSRLVDEIKVPADTSREAVTQVVMRVVRKTIGRESIGPDSDLFQEGLTSIHIARIVAALGHRYDVGLKGSDIFEVPTVNGMATAISQAGESRNDGWRDRR
jgi:amino acid adenylation domain-containing protein